MKLNRNNIKNTLNAQRRAGLSLGLAILCSTHSVYAEERFIINQQEEPSLWQLSLGLGAYGTPKYEGAKKYELNPALIVELTFMDHVFLSTSNGAGVYVINQPNWKAGIITSYATKRKEKDNDLLKGLGDVDGYMDVGLFATWNPEPLTVSLQAFQGTNRARGTHVTASLGHRMTFSDSWRIDQTISATYADSRYNNQYFGVTEKQSINSKHHYKKYDAGSGIKDVSYSVSVAYAITENWSASVFTEYKYLTGSVAESPIVKKGSKSQGTVGAGIIYTF